MAPLPPSVAGVVRNNLVHPRASPFFADAPGNGDAYQPKDVSPSLFLPRSLRADVPPHGVRHPPRVDPGSRVRQ